MNNSSSFSSFLNGLPSYGLSEADLNRYGLPYRSQAELVRHWEKCRKARKAKPAQK